MRGEIEIIPGWDVQQDYAAMVWNTHRDSGYLARAFPCRQRAIDFAAGMAEASNLKLISAEVLPMVRGVS